MAVLNAPAVVTASGRYDYKATGLNSGTAYSLLIDGVGTTTKWYPEVDGTLRGSFVVVTSKPDGPLLLVVTLFGDTTHTPVASATVQVQRVVTPPPVDPPPVEPPPSTNTMYRLIYGPGIESDSKDNFWVGHGQQVSFRFRATGGPVTHLAVNERGGSGYSAGNGGQNKAAFQLDVNGKPSGTDLGSVTWSPGNPGGDWEHKNRHALPNPVSLTPGTLYHIVFTNPASNASSNYVSLNVMYVYTKQSPRQPAFTDDFAVLFNRGAGWKVPGDPVSNPDPAQETPVFDLTYADGSHDGNGYYQITVTTPPSTPTQSIVSGNQQVRQRFTPKKDVKVSSMAFRLKRLSGSSPVTLSIDGLTSASVSTAGIPISTEPNPAGGNHWDGASLAGGRWVKATFAPVTLKAGTTYFFRVSSPSDSRYMAIPLRAVGDEASPPWGSRTFDDGAAERTSNGSSWSAVYPDGRHDWQFYMDIAP